MALSASGDANTITDTTGYATLASTDPGGSYSLQNRVNWNWNGGLIAVTDSGSSEIDFLVQNGYVIRWWGGTTFPGKSLTLDNCMVKFSTVSTNSSYTFPALNIYSANINIAQVNGGVTVAGDCYLKGNAAQEAVFSQTSGRKVNVVASLHGAADRVVRVRNEDAVTGNAFGITYFTGDNSDFLGTFVCAGSKTNVAIAVGTPTALGAGSGNVLTLSNEGVLFGMYGYAFTNATQSLALQNGGLVGTADAGGTFVFGGGTSVSGTGRLSCGISGDMTWRSSTVFGDVSISGISGLVLLGGVNTFTSGYSGTGVPVTAKDGATIVVGGTAGSVATVSSLTFEGATPEIRVSCATNASGDVVCDRLALSGALAKDAGAKIKILFDEIPGGVGREVSVRVLTSPSLGAGLTKDDFVMALTSRASAEAASFAEGTFSIETDGENRHLVWTWTSRSVITWDPDSDQYPGVSNQQRNWKNHPKCWSNQATPSSAYDYLTDTGLMRSTDGTFGGHSLTVARGADLAQSGYSATFPNMRLLSGGIVTARSQNGQTMNGNAEVIDDGTGDPFLFTIENAATATDPFRWLMLNMALKGSGNLEFAGYQQQAGKYGTFFVNGDNSAFTGGIMIRGGNLHLDNNVTTDPKNLLRVVFKDQNALGGDPATFMANGLAFLREGVMVVSNDMTIAGNRGVLIGPLASADSAAMAHIGAFDVPEGKTLSIATPVRGQGRIVKMGGGTLRLESDSNRYSSRTLVLDGTLVAVHTNALSPDAGIGTSASGLIRLEGEDFPYWVGGGDQTTFLNQQGCTRPTRIEVPALGDGRRTVTKELFVLISATYFDPAEVDIVNISDKSSLTWSVETDSSGLRHVFCTVRPHGMTIIFR